MLGVRVVVKKELMAPCSYKACSRFLVMYKHHLLGHYLLVYLSKVEVPLDVDKELLVPLTLHRL
jgi:hypothetical protein